MGILESYTGRDIDLGKPSSNVVDIEDIAHALSLTCRFGGHCRDFYSVAEHCVHVEEYAVGCSMAATGLVSGGYFAAHLVHHYPLTPDVRLALLLHDAAEAYVGDVVSPLKRLVPGFREIEDAWHLVIGRSFGLGDALVKPSELVTRSDLAVLGHEAVALFRPVSHFWSEVCPAPVPGEIDIRCWPPAEARLRFLQRFRELRTMMGHGCESWHVAKESP